jgi:leucyl/phenylalanyl-tRNA--protein transferase
MHLLNPTDLDFPAVERASPEGLLALGGDLSAARLLAAYRRGIFPWYSRGQPILWWSPDPRAVLFPDELRVSRSLRKRLRAETFTVTMDRDFRGVVRACAGPRRGPGGGTWITPEMLEAYAHLHDLGYAHSVEVSEQGRLVGGLYGVSLGAGFFGESMFSHASDASKVALVWLVGQIRRWGFRFVDCQLSSDHLFSLGAREIPRARFLALLGEALATQDRRGRWRFDAGFAPMEAQATQTGP